MPPSVMNNIQQPFMGEEDDPEYRFSDLNVAEEARALAGLEQLVRELSLLRASPAGAETALVRVCEHVMRDPVYAESTREAFRSTWEVLRSREAS